MSEGPSVSADWISIREAAAEVRCHPWTLWKCCRLGLLRSYRFGTKPGAGTYRIPRTSWEAFKRNALVKPPRPHVVPPAADEPLLIDHVMARARR